MMVKIMRTRALNRNEVSKNKQQAFEEGVIEWTKYFRANPHIFITWYLGIPLFLYQKIIIYMFDKFNYNMLVCSRGAAKSYLSAIYACARCCLYPHSKIIIASSTKG